MSGYKPGYSEIHSPWHRDGIRDGQQDAALMGNCPTMPPNGPDPAKVQSRMYRNGYDSVPKPVHQCTERCKK